MASASTALGVDRLIGTERLVTPIVCSSRIAEATRTIDNRWRLFPTRSIHSQVNVTFSQHSMIASLRLCKSERCEVQPFDRGKIRKELCPRGRRRLRPAGLQARQSGYCRRLPGLGYARRGRLKAPSTIRAPHIASLIVFSYVECAGCFPCSSCMKPRNHRARLRDRPT
jgi:hypothetical protein